ncbi:GntR family transcriptional regulator [Marinoscillum furvescens]|nr:GntR family transcriptional regulator [Marinoscillum furvescens]
MKLSADELGRQAYKRVKDMIINGELSPGQKVVQDKLAEQLGISRTPLRSALQMLEGENLIESIPRRGVVVKKFTDQEVIEIYDCRIALETTAVKLFTDRATDTQIKRLAQLFEPFKDSNPVDEPTYQKADSKFHNTIIDKCGNQFLSNLFHKGNLLLAIDMIGLVRPPADTLSEHFEIINAIQQRDPAKAALHLEEHLDASRRLIKVKKD